MMLRAKEPHLITDLQLNIKVYTGLTHADITDLLCQLGAHGSDFYRVPLRNPHDERKKS